MANKMQTFTKHIKRALPFNAIRKNKHSKTGSNFFISFLVFYPRIVPFVFPQPFYFHTFLCVCVSVCFLSNFGASMEFIWSNKRLLREELYIDMCGIGGPQQPPKGEEVEPLYYIYFFLICVAFEMGNYVEWFEEWGNCAKHM